jgi:pimeloyl-ACP methyl ester carboxylesterase
VAVPLVLLPGLLSDASLWAIQKEALGKDFEIYALPDFYGHSSLATMALAVLERVPRRFALAGHSMGALVALEIMAREPDRVEKLALLNTGAAPPSPKEAAYWQGLVALACGSGMAALAARWLPMLLHPEPMKDAELVRGLTAMMGRATPEIFASQASALLSRPDYRPSLPRILRPTLLVCGREDQLCPVAQHEQIAKAILGADLAVIEDCGHMSTLEQPSAVTARLRQWLGG